MTRAEMELASIRTSIEAYKNILEHYDLTEEKKQDIHTKIDQLCEYRNKILQETSNYGL